MDLQLIRFFSNNLSSLGVLFKQGKVLCYTLEDRYRNVKVRRETRIPKGSYRMTVRKGGGMDGQYARKFGSKHRGMLYLLDVPGFEYIYIHVGNYHTNTEGCILVGNQFFPHKALGWAVGGSQMTYAKIYPDICKSALDRDATITIYDCDGVPGSTPLSSLRNPAAFRELLPSNVRKLVTVAP
jgi:hypothetical protein